MYTIFVVTACLKVILFLNHNKIHGFKEDGVYTESFIQAFNLAQTAFNVQLASPQGKQVEFINQDDKSRKWLTDFKTKSFATPIAFSSIEASRYGALLIPDSPGAAQDLTSDTQLSSIITHFINEQKPICAIGMGVCALASAVHSDRSWMFKKYSLTAASVYELAHTKYFSTVSVIPEDFIKDNGGKYSNSENNAVHIVVDRHLVTGQNSNSTVMAVQNLILISNHRYMKTNTQK